GAHREQPPREVLHAHDEGSTAVAVARASVGEVQRGGRAGSPRDDGARMNRTPKRDRGILAFRFWRRDIGAEVDDEIAFHVDARADELVAGGMSRDAGRGPARAGVCDGAHTRTTPS